MEDPTARAAVPRPEVRALVVLGGAAPSTLPQVPGRPLVVAVDRGVDHALALGLDVDVVVGDLDSVTADGLERVRRAGATVERHPTDKDSTDLELALATAVAAGAGTIVAVGGPPDERTDHWVANFLLLGSDRWAGVDVDAWFGHTHLVVVRPGRPRTVDVDAGATVTLLPVGGDAVGVTTDGLEWPLRDETLHAGSTRGVSNRALDPEIVVSVSGGALIVLVPLDEDD